MLHKIYIVFSGLKQNNCGLQLSKLLNDFWLLNKIGHEKRHKYTHA